MRSVLDDRVALLAELTAASARQEEGIAQRDATALLSLLTARQAVVDRFLAGQSELLALTGEFESRVSALAPDEATALRSLLRSLSEGLHQVTARDEAAQALLRDARDETRGELMRTHSASGARAAYASGAGRTPDDATRFADRRA
jgi:hypothetical protein